SGLLQKHSLEARDIAKIIYPSPNSRDAKAIAKKLKLEDGQVQDSLFDRVGDCGTASPLLMLSAALDDAEQGDRILVASYGNGSDALLFRVTDDIARTKGRITVAKLLARKHEITNYNQYLTFRGVLPVETGIRGEEIEGVATQISRQWRERKEITALCGSKCKKCGTPQYPYQRVCVNPDCGATDEMEYYRFSDKKGALFTYTVDNLAFTFNPPQAYGVMAFEGGGKYWFDITDCDPDQLEVGMPMKMSFRRKYLDKTRGISGYFWKAVPALV
ncbi:MAG: OB-fold domain-containing protein, partial [Chloroflexota bacterium]|nr:OB-fold domain-containing protein [Chloroflexota bacterium]